VLVRLGCSDDPNDEEESDGLHDDVLWDDPNGDDPGASISAWFDEAVPFLVLRGGTPVAWTPPPSSPLLTLQRLRC
jgi:hypothetical protein